MKKKPIFFYRIGRVIVIALFVFSVPFPVVAEEGCRTGASALANAYVRINPLYTYFYGNLESYVASNREHFVEGGDSIRCAQALSQALIRGALQNYDPKAVQDAIRRQQEVDAQLGLLGIRPGSGPITVSDQYYVMALQVARLARVLPSAANGNYQPLYTPINEFEQLQMVAAQLLEILFQDPRVAEQFRLQKPLFEEAANLEFQLLLGMALSLVQW